MEYDDSPTAAELADRARAFVDEVVLPVERERNDVEAVSRSELADLREAARDYGVYCPQIGEEWGGMGVSLRDALPAFEQAGRSLLGPPAMRVDAPDEGNMHLLELLGTEAQKDRWLRPLVDGDLVSGFSMTEPLPGAGSDPKMIRTRAERDGDEWVIDGHKWWTTNGVEADLLLVFARTDPDAHPYGGCSILLVPADAPGVHVERDIPHLGRGTSHAEIRYDGVRVPRENLLGPENEGFRGVQLRLGPARLTHCMRFSGMAERALAVAKAYLHERRAFGEPLAEKQGLRFEIADAETRLHAARTTIRHAADRLAAGEEARVEVAMSKVFTASVAQDAIDTAVQLCGGNGIARDLPLADFYETVRMFRIVDGADEVHRRTIARAAFEEHRPEEVAGVARFDDR
ncbi:acyl-CoA dehydrogenase family protein [Halomarina pelagica]|uniref:acyl-CoA dehydrogenase family protein n=1 Tax=Halomarina pelagica TaxID=2961599 RepID=UPI0020C4D666|nr:acyl-CoA dehydrogenase family protein [Halomarina sp. BND7]